MGYNMFKKFIFLTLFGSFFLSGCHYNLKENYNDFEDQPKENKERSLCSKTKVILADGVDYSDLDISIDSRIDFLVEELCKKTGKYVSPCEEMIKEDSLMDILQRKKDELRIPNFEELTEEDIKVIQEKFPELSESQIIDELDVIEDIYQSELAALVVRNLIDNSTTVGSDELCVIEDNSRSLWSSAKKVWRRIIGKTSSAAKKIPDIDIVDKWRALKIGDDSITIYEVGAVLKHPFSALKLSKVKQKSYELTEQYMDGKEETRNKVDAFRHGIFSIALAKEGVGSKNKRLRWAKDFSSAHEKGYKYTDYSTEMDLHNNTVGLNFYDRMSKRRYKKILFIKMEVSPDEPSYADCCIYLKGQISSFK